MGGVGQFQLDSISVKMTHRIEHASYGLKYTDLAIFGRPIGCLMSCGLVEAG